MSECADECWWYVDRFLLKIGDGLQLALPLYPSSELTINSLRDGYRWAVRKRDHPPTGTIDFHFLGATAAGRGLPHGRRPRIEMCWEVLSTLQQPQQGIKNLEDYVHLLFPEKGSSNSGGCHHIFSSSHLHLHIFSSSHLHIFTYSCLVFTSSHLHIFSSSHLHIFLSSHLLIFTSAHLLIFTFSSHLLHISFTSSHLHIFLTSSSSHLHILPFCALALLPSSLSFLSISLLRRGAVPTRRHKMQPFRGRNEVRSSKTKEKLRIGSVGHNHFARNEVQSSKTAVVKLRFWSVRHNFFARNMFRSSVATLSYEMRFDQPPCHFLHRMGGVDPRVSLHFVEKNGVGGCHFVVNIGFEKALPFFVEDIITFGHQNEPFCMEPKAVL